MPRTRRPINQGVCARACAFAAGLALLATPALGDDNWNPFREPERRERPRQPEAQPPPRDERPMLPPMGGVLPSGAWSGAPPAPSPGEPLPRGPYGASPASADAAPAGPPGPLTGRGGLRDLPPPDERSRGVERGELRPAMTSDGAGAPGDLWSGLDAATIERHFAGLDLPPRSPAVHRLWRRMLLTETGATGAGGGHLEALRLEAMYRSGLVTAMRERLGTADIGRSPVRDLVAMRTHIALGDGEAGCQMQRRLATAAAELPPPLKAELVLLGGFCQARTSPSAAGLAADLAREEGAPASFALAMLDAIAAGSRRVPELPKRLSLLDYRFLELAGPVEALRILERADAALAATLAVAAADKPGLRVAAAEAAARANAIEAAALADAWRAAGGALREGGDPLTQRGDPALRRAQLFRAAEAERSPLRRTRLVRALIDDARRNGLHLQALQAVARLAREIEPAPEVGWFAETAIEAQIAAGDLAAARRLVEAATRLDRGQGGGLGHWLALVDIADPAATARRGDSLGSVEQLALRGRFSADVLHRLATVLDALDYNVPIPLWEAASRTPQPAGGHLPETGVLSELQAAAKRREVAATALLVMRVLGPGGPEGANIIALGDAVRALRRAGLEADARRIAVEALFQGWPRAVTF
jgi:hypothetical protein